MPCRPLYVQLSNYLNFMGGNTMSMTDSAGNFIFDNVSYSSLQSGITFSIDDSTGNTSTITNLPTTGTYGICYSGTSYNKLLLHGETFADSSPSNHTASPVGGVAISTTYSQFGSSIRLFRAGTTVNNNLSNRNYIDYTGGGITDWNFGTGSFTIDCWTKNDQGLPYGTLVSTWSSGTQVDNSFTASWGMAASLLSVSAGSGYRIDFSSREGKTYSSTISTPDLFPSPTYSHHIAIARDSYATGSTWYMFLDGKSQIVNLPSEPVISPSASVLYVGTCAQNGVPNDYTGYIDELRISKGIARWRADFEPPSFPY